MRNVICFVFIILAGVTSLNAQSVQLSNFEELMNALNTGYTVKVVIHYGQCTMRIDGKAEEAPDAVGGMELRTFEYFAVGTVRNEKAFVTASETVLIGHPFYGYVLNYAKIRIYDDDSVEIIARYLEPNTFEVKMDEAFTTIMNSGSNEGAAYFFAK